MGTPRPGNSSGDLISNGNVIEIGIMTIANETIDNIKLKMISPFVPEESDTGIIQYRRQHAK